VQTSAPASVDLNNATVDQLLTLPEFTLPSAEQFVAERQQRGGFQSVEQVAEFLNLKPDQADKLGRTTVLHPGPRTSSSAPASGRVINF
jgi:DNA uptake protein ComE-like DNA-binding protein